MKSAQPFVLVVLVVLVSALRGPAQEERIAVPEKKILLAERKMIAKEVAGAGLPRARRLLELGQAAELAPERRYALLEEAVAVAGEAGDLALALRAGRLLADRFELERFRFLSDLVRDWQKGRREPAAPAFAAEALQEIAGEALAAGDVAMAGRLLDDAGKAARKAKLTGLGERLKELDALVTEVGRAASRVAKAGEGAEARDRLLLALVGETEPTALAALVAACGEEAAPLAAAVAAAPTKSGPLLDLADLWWRAAEGEKGEALAAAMRARGLACALATVGRVSAELQERLAPWLERPQYRGLGGRLVVVGDEGRAGPSDFALAAVDDRVAEQRIDRNRPGWREHLPVFPEPSFTPGRRYLAVMDTSEGSLVVELMPEAGPRHVANFVYLARIGFYDDLNVHRIVQGFMAQFGCPKGDGTGNPGYFFAGELETGLKHDRTGVLSMANTGTPNSDGSQFFVTFTATPHLDGKHTAFGLMLAGRNTLLALERKGSADQTGRVTAPVRLNAIRIRVL